MELTTGCKCFHCGNPPRFWGSDADRCLESPACSLWQQPTSSKQCHLVTWTAHTTNMDACAYVMVLSKICWCTVLYDELLLQKIYYTLAPQPAPQCSKAMVILAMLASIEFFHSEGVPPSMPNEYVVIPVQANGLCFWSCLWLFNAATTAELLGWWARPRNASGYPTPDECSWERSTVFRWACDLHVHSMPESCRQRLLQEQSVEDEDIDTRLGFSVLCAGPC